MTPLGLPANIVLARLLLAKGLPVEMKKIGENQYSTYNGKIKYDGNQNVVTLQKQKIVLAGDTYEPQNVTEQWEIIANGNVLDGRFLS